MSHLRRFLSTYALYHPPVLSEKMKDGGKNKFINLADNREACSDSWRGGASEQEVPGHRVASLSDVNKTVLLSDWALEEQNATRESRGNRRFSPPEPHRWLSLTVSVCHPSKIVKYAKLRVPLPFPPFLEASHPPSPQNNWPLLRHVIPLLEKDYNKICSLFLHATKQIWSFWISSAA